MFAGGKVWATDELAGDLAGRNRYLFFPNNLTQNSHLLLFHSYSYVFTTCETSDKEQQMWSGLDFLLKMGVFYTNVSITTNAFNIFLCISA